MAVGQGRRSLEFGLEGGSALVGASGQVKAEEVSGLIGVVHGFHQRRVGRS
jgi:hypothetical protein